MMNEQQERGFWGALLDNIIKTSHVKLKIEVPISVYHRSLVFCEDVKEKRDSDFDEGDLIDLLYEDFLIGVKSGQSVEKWYSNLQEGDRLTRPIQVYQNNQEVTPLFPTLFEKATKQKKQFACIEFELEKDWVLRGEWFLRDMEELYAGHPFTIEKVVEILYCDFIYRIQRGGVETVIDNILKRLEEDDDEDE
ncbi:hypothetical protein QTG56_23165 (plasmid) [Rossellomorea sp. AcN35-11]|nr:hypothetical protein [Rossellomorea aquimaris]WJV32267.1 hypothetical protein QTG56_23165 [Rossellomorea sp. AcN35-11]